MIDNVTLKVFKYNSEKCTPPLQNICTYIKMHSTFKNICTEFQFAIPYDYEDYDWFDFEIGDEVVMWHNSLKVFYGKITDSSFNQKNNVYEFTCYDFTWWLSKNNTSFNKGNISAFSAISVIFNDVIPGRYHLPDQEWKNIMIGDHLIKNKSTQDVLKAILSSITKITGKYYYAHMSYYDGLVEVSEADRYFSGLTIQESSGDALDGNLIDYTITRSMQNMINKVQIYDENYNPIETVNTSVKDWGRYGVIQDTIVLDSNTNLAKAQDQANKKIEMYGQPSEDVIVKCIGDINYRVGYGVMVKLPNSYFYDKFMFITSSQWEWSKDGTFISTLTLSNSNKHELTEWESIEETKGINEDGTGSSGSAGSESVEAAVQWMINIANDDSHGYDQSSRWSPDYDCSSLVISGYQQAGIQLKSNGATYTGNMKEVALKTGFEEVKWDKDVSKLQRGDILLNEVHHVACYIGNGQMVSAHHNENGGATGGRTGDQTGHEIDVSEFRDYPWDCVLRYKVEESSTNGPSTGLVSNQLIDFIKGWEGFEPYVKDDGYGNPTLGYGMTGKEIGGRTSITEEEATKWLKTHVDSDYAIPLNNKKLKPKNISLTQNKFDCLVDMAYNLGVDGFDSLINMIANNASENEIIEKIRNYNHANGKVSAGLTKRCNARVKMWQNGVYDSSH